MVKTLFKILPIFLLSSCSSIPDQSQLSGIDSGLIIRRIMCEAKRELSDDPILRTKSQFAMALRFDFETTNQNSKDGDVTVTLPVALGTVSLGLDKGGVTDKYFGEENITVSNTFPEYRALPCDEFDNAHLIETESRGVLPITGRVKIGKVMRRYFELKRFSKAAKVSPFTRTLRFTVTIKGGLKTTIQLAYADGTKLNSNNTLSAERKDQHDLLITIVPVPTTAQIIASRTYYVKQLPPSKKRLTKKGTVIPQDQLSPGISATEAAKTRASRQAEDQFRLDRLQEIEERLQD